MGSKYVAWRHLSAESRRHIVEAQIKQRDTTPGDISHDFPMGAQIKQWDTTLADIHNDLPLGAQIEQRKILHWPISVVICHWECRSSSVVLH